MHSNGKLAVLIDRLLCHLGLDAALVVPAWVGLFDLASRNLTNRGKPRQAIGMLEQIGKSRKSLTADYPSRLASQYALAGAYEANGQVKEVVALLEEVVEIRSELLVVDYPS